MAGVGFELKKIFKSDSGILNVVKGYSITAAVTEGPMFLTIIMLFVLRYMLKEFHASYREQEIFLFMITYVMIFSLIIANVMLMFMDRFISDCIYRKKIDEILPAFYSCIFILLIVGGGIAYVWLMTIPMSWSFKLAALLQFSGMLICWVQVSFLSVIKQYGYVLLGFLAGCAVAIGSSYLLMKLGGDLLLSAMWGAALGFLVMLILFMIQILAYYPMGKFRLFILLPAFDRHKILLITGFFMGLGVYVHNFVVWFSEFRNHVFPTGVYCTKYDIPTFFATLTITPLLVQFVVSVETAFSKRNRRYFDTILYGGRLEDIKSAKKDMLKIVYRELAHMLEIQLIFTIIAATLLGNVLASLGLDSEMIGIYRVLCFGYCFYGMLKSLIIILLYFDDQAGACISSVIFVVLSIIFTIATLVWGIETWGSGFLAAAAITTVIAFIRLRIYLRRLEYQVFCGQKLFLQEEKGIFETMEEKLELAEQEFKKRSRKSAEKEI